MGKTIGILLAGAIVSSYFFPFAFTFLPENINTKMILAALSIPLVLLHGFNTHNIVVPQRLVTAIIIALAFSGVCYVAIYYNNTNDKAYVTYFSSFFTWLGGAYTTVSFIRTVHSKVNIKILTFYLAAACVFQCVIAIAIDQFPVFQLLVDSIISQGAGYVRSVRRLYGIGAQLDPAGVRFSIVLIMIAAVLTTDEEVRKNKRQIFLLLIAFFTITMLGNIMSRTTSVGFLISLGIFILSIGLHKLVIYGKNKKLYAVLFLTIILAVVVFIYLYSANSYFHGQLRYGFEGLFSWLETGVWRTDSTDKLNAIMWIWPTDTETWIIGTGHFSNFYFSTDIGYCRFVLYCGLIGMIVYSLFFIYNPYVFGRRYTSYKLMFLALMALSFILWLKVATDIFLIYALFYCLNKNDDAKTFNTSEIKN
jgi:hypothetical protein